MDAEKNCLESNISLLDNFAKDLRISRNELEEKLKLVGKNDKLLAMSKQIQKVYKTNPNAIINFGEFGENLAREVKLKPEEMYQALMVSAYNELLINIAEQLNQIYKKYIT